MGFSRIQLTLCTIALTMFFCLEVVGVTLDTSVGERFTLICDGIVVVARGRATA